MKYLSIALIGMLFCLGSVQAQTTIEVPESQGCPPGYTQINRDCSAKNKHENICKGAATTETVIAATKLRSEKKECDEIEDDNLDPSELR